MEAPGGSEPTNRPDAPPLDFPAAMTTPAATCPACGHSASGAFCTDCGARLGPRTCPACQAPLSPKARFCHRCGRSAAGAPGRGSERLPWIIAGSAIAVSLALIIYYVVKKDTGPARPDMANVGAPAPGGGGGGPSGPAPDISQMSPKERFTRLSDRIMRALDGGDTATVANFLPMALGAYDLLDTRDVDDRYRAAVLYLRQGGVTEALALADTILREAPDNLLGYLIRAKTAELGKDGPTAEKNRRAFLARFDAQIKLARPEYVDHRAALDEFRRSAGGRSGGPAGSGPL